MEAIKKLGHRPIPDAPSLRYVYDSLSIPLVGREHGYDDTRKSI